MEGSSPPTIPPADRRKRRRKRKKKKKRKRNRKSKRKRKRKRRRRKRNILPADSHYASGPRQHILLSDTPHLF